MNLITPDFGLLFWMVIIFGLVFFLLAKFGFPIITDMVDQRSAKIAQSLKDADEIQARMAEWKVEQAQMLEQARREQSSILREATETKAKIIADAKERAAHLVSESVVLEEAREEARILKSEARVEANEVRLQAIHDAKVLLNEVENELAESLATVRRRRSELDSKEDERI